MNNPILIRSLALGATAALAGMLAACGGQPDCTRALETADKAVRNHQPPGQWLHQVDDACSHPAMQRWRSALAGECAPVFGFHAALSGAERVTDCAGERFDSAWSLGEMIAEMRAEQDATEEQLIDDSLTREARRDLERRLVVIGRDLPQLEALARIDGYLPPAEIPGAEPETPEK